MAATKQDFQDMFEHAVHIGHRTQKWNPRMKKFLYGDRNGIHIINLERTKKYLDSALVFLSKLASEGKNVLFVSTKPQSLGLVETAAKAAGMPYVTHRWIPGLLTNFSTIKNRIKYLAKLKEEEASGEFEKYTKKEASKLKKTIDKLEAALGGVQNMTDKPDCVFVIDVVRDKIAVYEANRLGVPVVGIVDSNADPSGIDYPIPGNDDAIRSIEFYCNAVAEIIKENKVNNQDIKAEGKT